MPSISPSCSWRPTFGAALVDDGISFSVWAPNAERGVELVLADRRVAMTSLGDGRYEVTVRGVGAGTRYQFALDGGDPRPDPYSRSQPEGVHGPSEVVDPAFAWTDDIWDGLHAEGEVIYELHVGTFTETGTFAALIDELAELKRLGITAIELMPVAQCPGDRNWGYDGVDLFAPYTAYGRPDDLRRLVDAAHQIGLGVILDVVYNHFGPEGAYQGVFSSQYFSATHHTDWGAGLNWDGPGSEWVRRYAIDNACSWVHEYHIDGLRLDATHAIIDDSPVHLVQELAATVRELAAPRSVVVYAEDGRHDITRARAVGDGGEGCDGVWADDFHHEMRVLLTNAHENYFAAYSGAISSIGDAVNGGFSPVTTLQKTSPVLKTDPASAFVFCIQNHDQVGNRPFGDRLHHDINAEKYAVASAVLLFAPETPLLFMGQEFAASTPFPYFTDHPEHLGRLVTQGRREEFAGFAAFHDPDLRGTIPDPQAASTFSASKLKLAERETHAGTYRLYQDLLALRRDDPVLCLYNRQQSAASALTAQVLRIHRWDGDAHRMLIANFGSEVALNVTDELAGAPEDVRWSVAWHSRNERYGGQGRALQGDPGGELVIPARTAVILSGAQG